MKPRVLKFKTLLLLTVLVLPAQAAKKVYEVELDLVQGGERQRIQVTVPEGVRGKVRKEFGGDGNFIEIIATEESIGDKKGIMLDLAVGTTAKNGEKVILSRPQVFTQENRPTEVSVSHEDGGEDLNLSIEARPKNPVVR